jgi:hypothetical protein
MAKSDKKKPAAAKPAAGKPGSGVTATLHPTPSQPSKAGSPSANAGSKGSSEKKGR